MYKNRSLELRYYDLMCQRVAGLAKLPYRSGFWLLMGYDALTRAEDAQLHELACIFTYMRRTFGATDLVWRNLAISAQQRLAESTRERMNRD